MRLTPLGGFVVGGLVGAVLAGSVAAVVQLVDNQNSSPAVAAGLSLMGGVAADGPVTPEWEATAQDQGHRPGPQAGLAACDRDAGDAGSFLADTGAVGAVSAGAAGFGCLGSLAAGLPPTDLEQDEPARLYSLVTRDLPVRPVKYAPTDLVPFRGGPYELREEVADQLELLMSAAADDGHRTLVVTSGFRAYDVQAGTHQDWVGRMGRERADRVSAQPGHSEHQLGLAVDLAGTCTYACFGESADGRWVAANAHRWGFIVRYPEGGEKVTGYAAEPWHLRYVGPRASWQMQLEDQPYWERAQPTISDQA